MQTLLSISVYLEKLKKFNLIHYYGNNTVCTLEFTLQFKCDKNASNRTDRLY